MVIRHLRVAAIGALFLGLAAAASTHAWPVNNHTNYLTFSRAVALPGVELAAGTYIFETPDNAMANSIVRVSSRDRRTVYLTAFTREVERPRDDNGKLIVLVGETAAGAAQPITAWFPLGEQVGHRFVYGE